MCENFVCLKLAVPYRRGSPEQRFLPEPCYEYINCQICELLYNCAYCARKEICRRFEEKVPERQNATRNVAGRNN